MCVRDCDLLVCMVLSLFVHYGQDFVPEEV